MKLGVVIDVPSEVDQSRSLTVIMERSSLMWFEEPHKINNWQLAPKKSL